MKALARMKGSHEGDVWSSFGIMIATMTTVKGVVIVKLLIAQPAYLTSTF